MHVSHTSVSTHLGGKPPSFYYNRINLNNMLVPTDSQNNGDDRGLKLFQLRHAAVKATCLSFPCDPDVAFVSFVPFHTN